jgi:hypothetical protein
MQLYFNTVFSEIRSEAEFRVKLDKNSESELRT